MRIDIRPNVAGALAGLRATSLFKAIALNWTLPADMNDYRATQVWMGTSAILANATLYATVTNNSLVVDVPDAAERYFWVRSVNQYGRTDAPYSAMVSSAASMLESSDFENVVFDLAGANVVGELSKDRVTGLGALAALDRAGVADIDGLGAVATMNVIAADVIGAGVLAVGVQYAGEINASQINATSLDAITATIGVLRTQTQGGRVEIRDNLIQVFDTIGALRVKIGKLN